MCFSRRHYSDVEHGKSDLSFLQERKRWLKRSGFDRWAAKQGKGCARFFEVSARFSERWLREGQGTPLASHRLFASLTCVKQLTQFTFYVLQKSTIHDYNRSSRLATQPQPQIIDYCGVLISRFLKSISSKLRDWPAIIVSAKNQMTSIDSVLYGDFNKPILNRS